MIRARIKISTTSDFEGTFEAETLDEAIATAEMEARTKSEIQGARLMVLSNERIDSDEPDTDVKSYQGDQGQ